MRSPSARIGLLASKKAHTELLGRLEQRARLGTRRREAARELVLARTTRGQPRPPVVLGDHARGECQQSRGAGEGREGRSHGHPASGFPASQAPARVLDEFSILHGREPRALPCHRPFGGRQARDPSVAGGAAGQSPGNYSGGAWPRGPRQEWRECCARLRRRTGHGRARGHKVAQQGRSTIW